MSWWDIVNAPARRTKHASRPSQAGRSRRRLAELLEKRWLLAVDALLPPQPNVPTLLVRTLPVESQPLTIDAATIATFIDTAGADPLANYSATINWGDGSSATAGTIAIGSRDSSLPIIGNYFTVVGGHTYTTAGDYTLTITITDTDGSSATVPDEAHVGQPVETALLAHGVPVENQGLTINGSPVAAFIDTGGADPLENYSATINWGDGSSASAGIISVSPVVDPPLGTLSPIAGGYFIISGSHTYTATGDYNLTITITDTDGSSATVQSKARVTEATTPTLVATGRPVESQGLTVNGATVAAFHDTDTDPTTNYSATIDWGDGSSTSAGSIVRLLVPGNSIEPYGGYFTVSGDHTYTAAGDYTLTISITDTDGSSATVQSQADVAQPTLLARGVPIESQSLTVTGATVAAFADTGGADPLTDYSATIDWGDGSSTTAGTVVPLLVPANAVTLPGGFFTVTGDHTYTTAGDYTLTITITDTDGSSATVQSKADVAKAATPTLVARGVPVESPGLAVNGATVAVFGDTAGTDSISNYSATIDWGDGSSTTAGTIVAVVPGNGIKPPIGYFSVTGSHTYAASGVYDVKVAITDQDGSAANVNTRTFINDSTASFVASAFYDVLHRPADDSGLNYWNQQIQSGLAPAQFATDLTHSAEYYATNVIDPFYQTYLGRAADVGGQSYWTSQMQQGVTNQQLEADFISSAEFYAHAGGTNSAWVNAMYQDVLGRPADAAGLSYWEAQLSAGASPSSVATAFAASQEREAQIVQDDYFTYLGRSATPAEVNYWVAQFEQGMTNEDVVSGFVGSPEYVKLNS